MAARRGHGAFQPVVPSPLSQPGSALLAASTSSARSTISRASSAPSKGSAGSSGSRIDISTAFGHLADEDVRFFDQVVSLLAPGSATFAQLKQAHNDILAADLAESLTMTGNRKEAEGEAQEMLRENRRQRDARLWDALLRLMQVKGSDWRERWDAVRIGIGLEPRMSEEESFADEDERTETSTFSATPSDNDLSEATVSPAEHLRYLGSPRLTPRAGTFHGRYKQHFPVISEEKAHRLRYHENVSRDSSLESAGDEQQLAATGRYRPSASPTPPAYEDATQSNDRVLLRARGSLLHEKSAAVPLIERQVRVLPTRRPLLSDRSSTEEQMPVRTPRGAASRQFREFVAASIHQRDATAYEALERARAGEDRSLRLASARYDYSLLRRSLSWWSACCKQKGVQRASTARAQDIVFLSHAMERWKDCAAAKRKKAKLAAKADNVRVKLLVWRRWKRLAALHTDKKMEERCAELKNVYKEVVRRHVARAVRQAFHAWKQRIRHAMADDFRKQNLHSNAFTLWKIRAAQKNVMGAREKAMAAKRGRALVCEAFQAWRAVAQLQWLESEHKRRKESAVIEYAFDAWRRHATLKALQRAFERHRLQRVAIQRWCSMLNAHQTYRRLEKVAARRRDRRVKRLAFAVWRARAAQLSNLYIRGDGMLVQLQRKRKEHILRVWRLAVRELIVQRRRELQIQNRALAQWRHHTTRLRDEAAVKGDKLVRLWDARKQKHAWQLWKLHAQGNKEEEREVQQAFEIKSLTGALAAWRVRFVEQQSNARKATLADRYMLKRRVLDVWREGLLERRAFKLQEQFADRHAARVLKAWTSRFRTRQHERLGVAAVQCRIEDRIQRQALAKWTSRVVEVKSVLLEMADACDATLLLQAFNRWKEAMQRARRRKQVLLELLALRERDMQHRVMQIWHAGAHASRKRRQTLQQYSQNANQRLIQRAWDHWNDKTQDRRLGALEFATLVRRREIAIESIISKWITNTPALPAIRYRNTILKRHAFEQWRVAYPQAGAWRAAASLDRQQLLSQALATWKYTARQRHTLRAAARYCGASTDRLCSTHLGANRRAAPRFSSSPQAEGGPRGSVRRTNSASPSASQAARRIATRLTHQHATRTAGVHHSSSSPSIDLDYDLQDM
ncbi:hypothetical protein K437DRAFT_256801 [Tilletiaria anomala UBC 951]|uniref:Sfi1 spindle body domain-containing protein n=1 Tax=Tilletiaria anomala (strain ATCC 24038 / CBS 436.72 / UBC 951) TaxID=1037660 RepID=A0A066VXD2_TILAU|nr:uncharacterized protein K437DRAFT_256801 [Tilletiaria anomala UBC 951]KDN44938.1 hypothetical protein K437DRAFT_256801 [Tilletiaria anomala UBC 951]